MRCGSGVQTRQAICKAGDGTVLSDGSCSAMRRPNVMRPCDAGPCVTRWYVTDWEEVSLKDLLVLLQGRDASATYYILIIMFRNVLFLL